MSKPRYNNLFTPLKNDDVCLVGDSHKVVWKVSAISDDEMTIFNATEAKIVSICDYNLINRIHSQVERRVICDYCGEDAKLVDLARVYRGRSYGMIWLCECVDGGAYVGVHKNSSDNAPLGRLADKELRGWKNRAHESFDVKWKAGKTERKAAYKWLANKLGIAEEKCRIGMFDIDTCREVVAVCAADYVGSTGENNEA